MSRTLRIFSRAISHAEPTDLHVGESIIQNENRDAMLQCCEYLGLRAEIIDWQNRRYLTAALGVTGFVFFMREIVQRDETTLVATMLCILFSAFLAAGWAFVVYARSANVLLSEYIRVFHEAQSSGMRYEKRLKKMDELRPGGGPVDKIIYYLFLCLLLISVVGVWYQAIADVKPNWYAGIMGISAPTGASWGPWCIAGVGTVISVLIFFVANGRAVKTLKKDRKDIRRDWRRVKGEEGAGSKSMKRVVFAVPTASMQYQPEVPNQSSAPNQAAAQNRAVMDSYVA
jgi:hypothetical protein